MFDDIGRNFLMNPQNGLKVCGQCRHPPFFLLMLLVCKAQLTVLHLCVHACTLDPPLYEGPSEQGEGQGAVQTVSVPQGDRQA